MPLKNRLLDVAMYTAMACALVAGAAVAYQEWTRYAAEAALRRPLSAADWQEISSEGHVIGSPDAPIRVVEYGDYQCPACGRFAAVTWPAVQRRFGDTVVLVYHHWPLEYHEHAYAAARAAECAAAQGAFREYHELLYRQQQHIGTRTFLEFAADAGVPDLEAFTECSEEEASLPAIDRDSAKVRELRGTGTPTIFVNRRRLSSPLDSTALIRILEELIRNRQP